MLTPELPLPILMWLSSAPSKGRSGGESWEVSFCPRREVITEELIAMFPETAPWEGNRNNATLRAFQ